MTMGLSRRLWLDVSSNLVLPFVANKWERVESGKTKWPISRSRHISNRIPAGQMVAAQKQVCVIQIIVTKEGNLVSVIALHGG